MEIDHTIDQVIKKQTSMLDNLLQEAFLEHFGFPLNEVKDTENLEHIIVEGDPVESFRYHGETFLYWQKGTLDHQISKSGDNYDVTITFKYLKQ